jgi:hypothetical protein
MGGSVPALIGGAMKTTSLGVPSSRPMAELPQDDDATHDSDCWRGIVNRAIWFVEDSWQALVGLRPSPGYFHSIRRIDAQLAAAGFRPMQRWRFRLWRLAIFDRPGST